MSGGSGLTAVSLFADIGGFDEALRRAGVPVAAAVEIDPACRGVLRRHFPEATVLSDVTEVTGGQLRGAGFVPGRGIITGGFPCQDLSVAGRRAGLGGARSGLFWQIMRLADELSPRWLLLENVPGLLSAVCPCPGDGTCLDNGRAVRCGRWERRDGRRAFVPRVPHTPPEGACPGGCMERHGGAMGTVLGALGQRGYGFAYRVLDAQFFGVPQRRERVFIAGCLGDRAAPVEVLLEPEGRGGDLATGGEARARPPAGAPGIPGIPRLAGTLTAGALDGHDDNTARAAHLVAHAVTAREAKGPDSDATSGFILGTAATLQGGGRRGHRVDAEGAAGGHLVPVPVALRGRAGGSQAELGRPGDPAFTVRGPGGGSSYPMIAHALTSEGADASEDGTGRGTPLVTVPVAATLTSGTAAGEGIREPGRRREDDVNLVAVPLLEAGAGIGADGDPMFTLQAGKQHAVGVSENQRGEVLETAYSRQLTTGGGTPGQGYGAVRQDMAVRRLTPLETERLQGFPDDWTRWLDDGTEQSDSARYRQTGNAVAVPVAEWIVRRLVAVEAARDEAGEAA